MHLMNSLKKFLYNVTHWETWDWRIKYVPLIPSWIWYSLRSGSVWFFTPSNPSLVFGGFDGVSKKEMYKHLPENSYPKSIYVSAGTPFLEVEGRVITEGFSYPVVVKPEVGRKGLMFRKIESAHDLMLYHKKMPVNYILQDYIDYPVEVSVFYYRYPNQENGTITGFLRKEFLTVTGDGRSTLLELIRKDARASLRLGELKTKHKNKLGQVIPDGESYRLSYALSRGGKLVSLEHEKDERLLKVFDKLSHHAKHFYYGRYDIKCASIEDLKEGRNFCILEYNGSGGEPQHVYGNGHNLLKACRILLQHWEVMYQISKHNHQAGVNYWKFNEGWKFFRRANRHMQILRRLDAVVPAK